MKRLSLKAGYCLTESGSRCTFERSQCGVDDTVVSPWRSAGEMRGSPYTAHGGSCLLAKTVREMTLGRCSGKEGGDGGRCVPNASSCKFATEFYESYDCKMDKVTFGRCGERCSWSPDDCGTGEEWTFPVEGCSYDKVRVGGCYDGTDAIYCAVSEDGCGGGSSYLSPTDVALKMDTECYIGMQASVPMEEQLLLNEALSESATGSANDGLGIPAIIGAAVGGVFAVALLGYGVVSLHRNKKAGDKKAEHVFQTNDFENPPSPKE